VQVRSNQPASVQRVMMTAPGLGASAVRWGELVAMLWSADESVALAGSMLTSRDARAHSSSGH
jgi:hypothetical protein